MFVNQALEKKKKSVYIYIYKEIKAKKMEAFMKFHV